MDQLLTSTNNYNQTNKQDVSYTALSSGEQEERRKANSFFKVRERWQFLRRKCTYLIAQKLHILNR